MNEDGTLVVIDTVEKVQSFEPCRDIRDVRSFLGLSGYYRKFIKDYATIAAPLHKLLQKNKIFKWTVYCQEAFEELKKALTSAPILIRPDYDKKFILYTDASRVGLGAVLS